MRAMKLSIVAFCACFLIGLGVVALYPAPAQAGPIQDPCYTGCPETVISCGAPCGEGLWEHYEWFPYAAYKLPCLSPFDCGGDFVGCGLLCEPL